MLPPLLDLTEYLIPRVAFLLGMERNHQQYQRHLPIPKVHSSQQGSRRDPSSPLAAKCTGPAGDWPAAAVLSPCSGSPPCLWLPSLPVSLCKLPRVLDGRRPPAPTLKSCEPSLPTAVPPHAEAQRPLVPAEATPPAHRAGLLPHKRLICYIFSDAVNGRTKTFSLSYFCSIMFVG